MERIITPVRDLNREVNVPGDRRISMCRAVLAVACQGPTTLRGYSPDPDCTAVLAALRALGVSVEEKDGAVRIEGLGDAPLLRPDGALYCGRSADGLALLCGLLAGRGWEGVLSTGDGFAPAPAFPDALRRMGARITCGEDGRPPIRLSASALSGVEHDLGAGDWETKSALLLAALSATGRTTLSEEAGSPDHLERALKHSGVSIHIQVVHRTVQRDPEDLEAELARRIRKLEGTLCPPLRRRIELSGPVRTRAQDVALPGDLSLAAFPLVAGAIVPGAQVVIPRVGLNPARLGVLEVLRSMGAEISTQRASRQHGEPVGDLAVRRSDLRGVRIAGDLAAQVLDAVPALVVAATQAAGETVIRDVAPLRKGQADRLAALAARLKRMGARIGELPDGLIIEGGHPLDGTDSDSLGVPQIAMALGLAGLVAYGNTAIADAHCADTVFPGFFDQLGV